MFESVFEVIKTFSFQSVLKGNLMSSPGSFNGGSPQTGGKGKNSKTVGNRFLSTYYSKMQELTDYELNDLTNTSMTIYIDYLMSYVAKDGNLIELSSELENYEKDQERLNRIFIDDLDIVNETKDHFWDILYNGAYCFKKAFDPETQRYIKFNLHNPHNVVTISRNNRVSSHLVVSKKGVIFEVDPRSIFRLGRADLTLINDINKAYFETDKEDTLVKDDKMSAGYPLYYNITNKVKEFLLKEQILSLLSIKDLVQPLLLLVRLDKNTAPDEGNRLALNIENMINKYSDISSILSNNFSINGLLDSLMNNIRVLPDWHSSMGDMSNIDLSKITNKIQEIESTQDNKKENILTSISIPRSLYNGESTKWDAIKSSQRLNSRINNYVVGITDSIKFEVMETYKELTGREIKPDQVKINLFTKTDADYNVALTNTEIIGQLVEGVQRILQGGQSTLQEIKIIDPEQYAAYISEKLKMIDPDVSKFITEESIKNYIQSQKHQGE